MAGEKSGGSRKATNDQAASRVLRDGRMDAPERLARARQGAHWRRLRPGQARRSSRVWWLTQGSSGRSTSNPCVLLWEAEAGHVRHLEGPVIACATCLRGTWRPLTSSRWELQLGARGTTLSNLHTMKHLEQAFTDAALDL